MPTATPALLPAGAESGTVHTPCLHELDPALSTDVVSLDAEHLDLIGRMARIDRAVTEGDPPAEILEAVGRLREAVMRHFGREERVMANIAMPGLEAHRRLHAMLLEDAERVVADFSCATPPDDFRALAQYLRMWMLRHVSHEDVKIRHFLNR